MVTETKTGSAQYERRLTAYMQPQALIDASNANASLYVGDLPGNAFLVAQDVNNVAQIGSAATLLVQLVDPVDDSLLADLGIVDLAPGGRVHTDQSGEAQIARASRVKITPDVTGAVSGDIEFFLSFYSTGATDESLD